MLVAVGMERADYLADWKIEAANTGVLVFSFLLLSLLSAGFLLKLLNRMLRESARNERYLQCASDGIHVLDAQGQVVEANDRFCAMLGYGHDELVGMRVDNFDADAIERPPLALIDELLTRGVPLTFERRHLTRDGELIDVEINAAPFTLEDKQFIYASARDIRERKQAQAALLEAKRAAEAANLAKSQFLATMSHEIRTPLNGVLGMAQLLQLPELGEQERQEYARTIMSSGETLLALLNDILDLSKIDAGKMELIPAVFAPRQLVDEIAALFAETAHRKGLELEAAWHGPADARYWGDPIRLRQMLANLIGNAIKFTDRGGVRVAARETADGLLEFAVADTGIGIAAAQRDRLFKPFTQLDGSATRRHGGTGLGLSIVFSLARLMDGDVEVDSVPGEGSTFRLRVRLQRAQDGMVAVGRTVAQTGTPVSVAPVGRRCRILVAEDNRTNRQVIEAILDKCGQEHRSVENGEAAVAAVTAGEWRPDLVLMDCQMPGMDGFEATARIRSWEAEHGQPRLPIVALTASVYPEDRDQCLSAGMDDFLAKPVNMARLREVLDKWLERDAGQA
jgi:PAS domain S-box-containing protein